MDIFTEQLIKKKRTKKDFLKVVLAFLGAILTVYILSMFAAYIPFFSPIMLILIFVMIYGLCICVTNINLEYEYTLTNDELDIDKIVNLKKRCRMTTVNIREIVLFGSTKSQNGIRYANNSAFKKIYACEDKSSDDTCFVIYNENGDKKMLYFTPNADIKGYIKKLNLQKSEI